MTMITLVPSPDTVRAAPKVLLHDHLDGGLRPWTVIELAREVGYTRLPTEDPEELGRWFRQGADRKSLELYLDGFSHTVGVMQTPGGIERVAAECAQDLAEDGVVYAEVRYAPELSTQAGLTLDEVMAAWLRGFQRGADAAAAAGTPITIRAIVTAMRQFARSVEIAELAVRYRDAGVVGFDIAGPEAGFPPSRHLDAFQLIHRADFHVTIHAGEAFGLPSIWEALQWCGAERLGHGVRLVDDIEVSDGGRYTLGRLAAYVRDRRVPLEMCPTSNVHTGAVASIEEHPIDLLRRLRFRVTVNTDNRLMSGVTLSSELELLARTFGFGLDELQWLTLNAMKSSFLSFDQRIRIINGTIKPGYARLMAEATALAPTLV
jgi:adenosine deaminase